jgi:signal peptidase I
LEDSQLNVLPETSNQKTKPGWVSFLIDTLETLFLAVIFYLGVNAVSARIMVLNHSMEPTLYEGELLLLNKLAYRVGTPQRGDIIVFHFPLNPQEDYIKRVIGTPGDTVIVNNGVVSVNGQIIQEDYIAELAKYNGRWDVPANQLFVLGDNRNKSSDSHVWGFVPYENIIGKAIFVYWPPANWKIIRHSNIALSSQ